LGKGLDTSRFARWHDAQGKEYPISNATGVSAADDLTTTIGDYCKLGLYLMNGAGLSATLYKDMVSPQGKAKEGHLRALGWGLVNNLPNGEYALEHGGSDIGVRTMAIFLPKSKRGIVVMTNGDNGLFIHDRIIKESFFLGKDILSILKGTGYSPKRIVLPDTIIESYVGTYRQQSGKLLTVTKDGNAIKVSAEGAPTALLFPESTNKFFLQDYPVQIEFHASESDKPSTLIMYEGGKHIMELIKVGTKP
jgi:CubicO group peptidase (beta-lactamase class C family)